MGEKRSSGSRAHFTCSKLKDEREKGTNGQGLGKQSKRRERKGHYPPSLDCTQFSKAGALLYALAHLRHHSKFWLTELNCGLA